MNFKGKNQRIFIHEVSAKHDEQLAEVDMPIFTRIT
ncbi:hypothetical protein L747_09925 [Levilactobacillus brevis BSO 464]|nr:hypothetical protein L747_09925 [Levilactobacillus brevis BSO 464]